MLADVMTKKSIRRPTLKIRIYRFDDNVRHAERFVFMPSIYDVGDNASFAAITCLLKCGPNHQQR